MASYIRRVDVGRRSLGANEFQGRALERDVFVVAIGEKCRNEPKVSIDILVDAGGIPLV